MGTTEQKLNFIKRAKRNLKNQINTLFGENITDETPFIDYAGKLHDFYNRLPKTTYQTGTSINLGKTLKGKLDYDTDNDKYIIGLGDTSQESTTGKNLYEGSQDFSGTWNNASSWLDVSERYNGLVVKKRSGQWTGLSKDIEVETGTYTFSLYVKADNSKECKIYITGGTGAAATSPTSATVNATTNWNRYYVTFNVTTSGTIRPRLENTTDGGTNYTYICGYQLEKSSSMTSYEPYTGEIPAPNPSYSEPISVVTGEQSVVVHGKNLFNGDLVTTTNTTNWSISFSNNILNIKHNNSYSTGYPTLNLGTLASGTYVLSGTLGTQIGLYRDGSYSNMLSNNSTFSVSGNEEIMLVWASSSIPSGETKTYTNIQLEKGSSATTFESYITPTTTTLHLGTNEFCKIGDYADELLLDIDNDKVYKKGYIGKSIITSFVNKAGALANNIFTTDVISNIKKPSSNGNLSQLYSNYFTAKIPNQMYTNDLIGIGTLTTGGIYCGFGASTTLTTLELANSWAGTNNIIVYYLLETPTLTEIEDDTLKEELYNLYASQSIEGTTIIETSGNLPIRVKVRGLKGE